MKVWLLIITALAVFAQDTVPAPAIELTPAEKRFQEAMANVKLTGYFTLGDSNELHDDAYTIVSVTKIKEDTWKFQARIQYNKRDVALAMNLPVKFAGDTPVISLTDFTVPGFGSFTARVVIHHGTYAGMWSSAGGREGAAPHGGMMFGRIVKIEPAPQQ